MAWGKPATADGLFPDACELLAPHQARLGNHPVGIALAHAHQGLAILNHFEPPITHGFSRKNVGRVAGFRKVRDFDSGRGGAIAPITDWRLYADPALAPLWRSSGGAISRSWFGSYGPITDIPSIVCNSGYQILVDANIFLGSNS